MTERQAAYDSGAVCAAGGAPSVRFSVIPSGDRLRMMGFPFCVVDGRGSVRVVTVTRGEAEVCARALYATAIYVLEQESEHLRGVDDVEADKIDAQILAIKCRL